MIRNTYFGLALFSLLSLGIESKTLSARGRYLRHDNPPVEDNTKSKASLNDFVANQMNLKFFEAALVTTGWARELEGQKHHTFFAPCDDTFNDAAQKGLKDKLKKPMYRTHLVCTRTTHHLSLNQSQFSQSLASFNTAFLCRGTAFRRKTIAQ